MKIDLNLSDFIDNKVLDTLRSLKNLASDRFTDIAAHLSLDPASDFRHSDLAFVRFDGCDLRGYDFTGADLKGTSGRNVKWDETTKLEGADLSGSLFAYVSGRQKFFEDNPLWHDRFVRLTKSNWTTASLWVFDNVHRNTKDREKAIEVAKALFDATKDTVIQTNILLSLGQVYTQKEQHLEFLLYTIARYGSNKRAVRAAVTALISLFVNEPQVIAVLKEILLDPFEEHSTRSLAFKGLLYSKYVHQIIPELEKIVAFFPKDLRRMYVGRIASLQGPEFVQMVREPFGPGYVDFEEEITDALIRTISRRILEEQATKTIFIDEENDLSESSKFSEARLRKICVYVREGLLELRHRGIPFRVQGDND